MFKKKKDTNVTQTGFTLVVGAILGFVWALLSAKQTGKDFQKDLKKKANKAVKESTRKIGKEFLRAKKELGTEFDSRLTDTFSNIKSKSKVIAEDVKKIVNS